MKTTNWNYDFPSLPHWDNREKVPYVYDEFFELPQSGMLCCLYSICEAGMMNYLGFLAVLKNKEKPELVLNLTDFPFCVNFSASEDGNLIFLQPSIYDRSANRIHRPVLILDMQKNRFSYIKTANHCPDYQVVQRKANVFLIEADQQQRKNNRQLAALHGRKIRKCWLRWYAMERLPSLPRMIL